MTDNLPICMIRACGKGERLAPLTDWWQKCILPVKGKPLLAHWLDALNVQGLSLQTYVVYRYRWIQVLDVVREWQFQQAKCLLRIDTVSESLFPDQIWADVVAFWAHLGQPNVIQTQMRRKGHEPLFVLWGDNWSPQLGDVVRDFLGMRHLLDVDHWGIIGLMPTEQSSNHTEAAIKGEGEGPAPILWPLQDYLCDLPEGPKYMAWTGMGLFSPAAIEETRDCRMPQEAFGRLARMGKLLGMHTPQEYWDIGTPEAYRRVGAI